MEIHYRPAVASDAQLLTQLAEESKGFWGYPPEYMELWKDDLLFTAARIQAWKVVVAERAEEILGVVALSWAEQAAEIEHLWVKPSAMQQGIGRQLFRQICEEARALELASFIVISEPNAEKFYRKLGGQAAGSVESKPAGRRLPRLRFELDPIAD